MKIKIYDMLTLLRLAAKARGANIPSIERVKGAYINAELEIEGLRTWRKANLRDAETLPKEGAQIVCRRNGKNVLGTAVSDEFGLISIDIGEAEPLPLDGLIWLPIPD